VTAAEHGAAMLGFAAIVPPLVARHAAFAAADSAALAAADVALGAAPGAPCDRASAVASAVGARLAECRQRGVVVRVRVLVTAPLGDVAGEAQAGPDPADPPE
jgi:secretion/DNA translocation related TadE-like protein